MIQTTKYLKVKPSDEYAWNSYGSYVREFDLTYPASKKKDNRKNKHKIRSFIQRREHRDRYVEAAKMRDRMLLSVKVPNLIHKLASIRDMMPKNSGTTIILKRYK
jgi:hypothetical protein